MTRKFMRILVLFDLPVTKPKHRKEYARFRKFLINDGYEMMQYSVYVRLCKGDAGADKHIQRLNANLPRWGVVRALVLTDQKYCDMHFLVGTPESLETIKTPNQLSIF